MGGSVLADFQDWDLGVRVGGAVVDGSGNGWSVRNEGRFYVIDKTKQWYIFSVNSHDWSLCELLEESTFSWSSIWRWFGAPCKVDFFTWTAPFGSILTHDS